MQTKLNAQWHKFQFIPPSVYRDDYSLDGLLHVCFGLKLSEFEPASASPSAKTQYKQVETYRRWIDLEFVSSPKHGRHLHRIVIQGKGLENMPLDIGRILSIFEEHGFTCNEAHSRILISGERVSFDTINKHCLNDAYTATCRKVSPITNPDNRYAKTWAFGSSPSQKSVNTAQGRRVIIYEADKVHPELAAGTVEIELQLSGSTAQYFVFGEYTRTVDLTVKTIGVIRSFLCFKTLTGDRNISRRNAAKWWNAIVDDYSAIYLPRLDRKSPETEGRMKRFVSELHTKKIKLGEELFIKSLAAFVQEQGLIDKLRFELV